MRCASPPDSVSAPDPRYSRAILTRNSKRSEFDDFCRDRRAGQVKLEKHQRFADGKLVKWCIGKSSTNTFLAETLSLAPLIAARFLGQVFGQFVTHHLRIGPW
jgi:hypothetical protein